MNADRETVGREGDGNGSARKSREIEPLRVAHGVQVARASRVVAAAVAKGGSGRNRREKNRSGGQLADETFTERVARGAGLEQAVGGDGGFVCGDGEIFPQLRAEKRFFARGALAQKVCDHRAEEIPPEIERLAEPREVQGLDGESCGFQ